MPNEQQTDPANDVGEYLPSTPPNTISTSYILPTTYDLSETLIPLTQLPPDANWRINRGISDHLMEMVNVVLSRESLPFSLINKSLFKQDFHHGLGEYHSTALVQSICSLATLMAVDRSYELGGSPPALILNSELGDFFAHDAVATLLTMTSPHNIGNLQALGVLSVYYMGRGQSFTARKMAADYAKAAAELCLSQPVPKCVDDNYIKARASTFCGAISLDRYA
ncbi:hypothetical protein QQS21_011533 [Conoideocrella luteorostrata]|uniref:Uncharacterized protein n=1 Tax=Conoideocrella luteorostrata TaxID=1105319 RepID=A0AAJ0CFQ7_9HYPO|nr:hypothetical protein QQS21_011533 [Conoideocrella luteorostrata]